MLIINDDLSLYVTRGDIVHFVLRADDNGENYVFRAGDVVRMTVYEKKACHCVVLQKDFPITEDTETLDIYLEEKETRIGDLISKPVDYWYEIELNPLTAPQTIIGYDDNGAKVFRLFPEGDKVNDPEPETKPEDIPVVDGELNLLSPRPVENRVVSAAIIRIEERAKNAEETVAAHTESKDNPHGVTAEQVGLGNVPNVSTNNQTPTYEDASGLQNLTSGEKLSAAFGKIKKAIAEVILHLGNKENPHGVTAAQVKARPADWMPSAADVGAATEDHAKDENNPHNVTAEQVGARPADWMPSAADVGALCADDLKEHTDNKENPHGVTAEQVGARPDDWFPSLEELKALGNEGDQTVKGKTLVLDNSEGAEPNVKHELWHTHEGEKYKLVLAGEHGVFGLYMVPASKPDKTIGLIGIVDGKWVMKPSLGVGSGGTGGTTKEEARANIGCTAMSVVWKNANVDSSFPDQTITLNLLDCLGVFIRFRGLKNGSRYYSSGFLPVGAETRIQCIGTDGTVRQRSVTVSTNGITFSKGEEGSTEGVSYVIPAEIYGVRGAFA